MEGNEVIYTICGNCGREIEKGTKCTCGIDRKRYKEYNKRIRWNKDNIKYSKFYNSVEWKRLSNYVRSKYNNMCVACLLEKNEIQPCVVVHHIIPIRNSWAKRLEEDNLISLCYNHHNMIDHKNITKDYIKKMQRLQKEYLEKF